MQVAQWVKKTIPSSIHIGIYSRWVPTQNLWWFFDKLPVPHFQQIARSEIFSGFSTNWMRLMDSAQNKKQFYDLLPYILGFRRPKHNFEHWANTCGGLFVLFGWVTHEKRVILRLLIVRWDKSRHLSEGQQGRIIGTTLTTHLPYTCKQNNNLTARSIDDGQNKIALYYYNLGCKVWCYTFDSSLFPLP